MIPVYFNRFILELPEHAVKECSQGGDCTAVVTEWTEILRDDLKKISAEDIADELHEYGGWDWDDLEDDEENLRRLVWIAACDAAEGRYTSFVFKRA